MKFTVYRFCSVASLSYINYFVHSSEINILSYRTYFLNDAIVCAFLVESGGMVSQSFGVQIEVVV